MSKDRVPEKETKSNFLGERRNRLKERVLRITKRSEENGFLRLFGDDSKEVTPVPIPNTVVKLLHADDTWWVTARESK